MVVLPSLLQRMFLHETCYFFSLHLQMSSWSSPDVADFTSSLCWRWEGYISPLVLLCWTPSPPLALTLISMLGSRCHLKTLKPGNG